MSNEWQQELMWVKRNEQNVVIEIREKQPADAMVAQDEEGEDDAE